MAQIGRMAGSILVGTQGSYVRVGQTKEPCDYAAFGFERPPEIDGAKFVPLNPKGAVPAIEPVRIDALEGDALVESLCARMLIVRNASVSERLWRLVTEQDDMGNPRPGIIDANWLVTMPEKIWDIVRDTVLRC